MKIMDRQTQYYEIVGDNLEMLKISIDPKFKVFAEAGKMIYTRGNVTMEIGILGSLFGGEDD